MLKGLELWQRLNRPSWLDTRITENNEVWGTAQRNKEEVNICTQGLISCSHGLQVQRISPAPGLTCLLCNFRILKWWHKTSSKCYNHRKLVHRTEEWDVYRLSGTLLSLVAAVLAAFLNPCTGPSMVHSLLGSWERLPRVGWPCTKWQRGSQPSPIEFVILTT